MDVLLTKNKIFSNTQINICGSKSESNRLLILQKLFHGIEIQNLSASQDTKLLSEALNSKSNVIDIHHAGTAMRFLTAYYACQPDRKVTITGSERMKERPIKILVDALRILGAEIGYKEKEGYPPLQIFGKQITQNKVSIDPSVSSQYISALMLIAPALENGMEITLTGNKTSQPYLKMTVDLLAELGIVVNFSESKITIKPFGEKPGKTHFTVESDWSSASYFFNAVAFSPVGSSVKLSSFFQKSKQGDAVLPELFKNFGVETTIENDSFVSIKKTGQNYPQFLQLNLIDTPDLAQTLASCCFGLNIPCELTGLRTLKIKETDRLQALKNEITKLGGNCDVSDSGFILNSVSNFKFGYPVSISTYNDHRMAMAFATLSFLFPIKIEDAQVVEKSYPEFWQDLKKLGIVVKPVK